MQRRELMRENYWLPERYWEPQSDEQEFQDYDRLIREVMEWEWMQEHDDELPFN